jgi:ATPase subunit of ABC transporter with duplicated ATPase domains
MRLDGNDKTVFEEISGGADILTVGKYEMPPRLHRPLQLQGRRPAEDRRQLSGGERGRLHMAKTLIAGGNVLLLDEPSNDLDVETLRALEDALLEFAGSVLVISHDRWFLDRIATHILACEGDSQWTFFRATTRNTRKTRDAYVDGMSDDTGDALFSFCRDIVDATAEVRLRVQAADRLLRRA